MRDIIKKKRLFADEMRRYFGDKNKRALVNLRPSALRDLIDDLESLEEVISKTDKKLKAAFTVRDAVSEQMIDLALASLKH